LISLVGAGVIMILVALLAVALRHEVAIYIMLLLILATFYMFHHVFKSSGKKVLAGVNLVWYTMALPFLGLVVYLLANELSKPVYITDANGGQILQENRFHTFINWYCNEIYLAYFIILFVYVGTLLSRNYRNWMAMTEE
ncbi:MAG: hypothetical protein JWO06_4045, partial [Bacteroidota bacterium]|nr:hypothetical protein [Bacteroidota bacterium]